MNSCSTFNIGIIPQDLLFFKDSGSNIDNRIFPLPEFITKECLIQLQYCQEIQNNDLKAFHLSFADLMEEQSFLFFPALCTAKKCKIELWTNPPEVKYSQGWIAQCTNSRDYFPPRFLHVLLLRLVFKFTLSTSARQASMASPEHAFFQRRHCQMWSSGVFWSMTQGVKCIVELVKDSKELLLLIKSDNDTNKEFKQYFCEIVDCIMCTKEDFCPHIDPEFFLLDSTDEADYSSPTHRYKMSDVTDDPNAKVIHNVSGNKAEKISRFHLLQKPSNRGSQVNVLV